MLIFFWIFLQPMFLTKITISIYRLVPFNEPSHARVKNYFKTSSKVKRIIEIKICINQRNFISHLYIYIYFNRMREENLYEYQRRGI